MYNLILQDCLCTRNVVGAGRHVFSHRVVRSLFCCKTERLSAVCLVSPSGRWSETSLSSAGSSPSRSRLARQVGARRFWVSPSLHRLLLLQLDLCCRTFPHDCRENRRRRAMSGSRCRFDARSEEIKPADVQLTSCFFQSSSFISDFKLKSRNKYWCLGVKSGSEREPTQFRQKHWNWRMKLTETKRDKHQMSNSNWGTEKLHLSINYFSVSPHTCGGNTETWHHPYDQRRFHCDSVWHQDGWKWK